MATWWLERELLIYIFFKLYFDIRHTVCTRDLSQWIQVEQSCTSFKSLFDPTCVFNLLQVPIQRRILYSFASVRSARFIKLFKTDPKLFVFFVVTSGLAQWPPFMSHCHDPTFMSLCQLGTDKADPQKSIMCTLSILCADSYTGNAMIDNQILCKTHSTIIVSRKFWIKSIAHHIYQRTKTKGIENNISGDYLSSVPHQLCTRIVNRKSRYVNWCNAWWWCTRDARSLVHANVVNCQSYSSRPDCRG